MGTPDEYVEYVSQFKKLSVILSNARKLKNCVDKKLTDEDKQHVLSGLVSAAVCACARAWLGVLLVPGQWGACLFSSPPRPFLGNLGGKGTS